MTGIKANPKRLVAGVGVNDVDYEVSPHVNGNRVMCQFYRTWTAMLARCYSKLTQERQPTYIGCSVSEDWLSFSNFKSWMETQDWKGKQLDKDLLIPGNKLYSPDTCVFVSSEVNSLMIDCAKSRGLWPVGVFTDNQGKNFRAQIRLYGKRVRLGCFDTPSEAHQVYVKAKVSYIRDVADTQTQAIQSALHRHADILEKTTASHYQTNNNQRGFHND